MTTIPRTDLAGKRALVCGASRGIGRACAVELAARGAEVILLARDGAALEATCRALATHGSQAHAAVTADMRDPEALTGAVMSALHDGRPVEVLVNNSGGPAAGPVAEAAWEQFPEALRQHLGSAHVLTGLLLPGMKTVGYGRIVNIISTSVKQPIPGLGVSNTIRGAVANWAKTLAGEVARYGITVNNVLPGFTRTDRLESLIQTRARKEGKSVQEIEANMLATIPAASFGEAEDVARAVGFLASPDARYITGINLPVDGGRTGSL